MLKGYTVMTTAQLQVYHSLSTALGGKVIDPKWAPKHKQADMERTLKGWVRENWADRRDFPSWVHDYVAKWKTEAASEAREDVDGNGGRAEEEGDVR